MVVRAHTTERDYSKGTLEYKTHEWKDKFGSQHVKFYDDNGLFPSVYNLELNIFDEEECVVELKGRVVKNIIISILNGANKYHLEKIRDGINERLNKDTEDANNDA